MAFEIIIYEKENGDVPFQEFLNSLTDKMKAKIFRDLDLLQTVGNKLREPYSAPLGNGIFELRTKFGSDLSRTIYFFYVNNVIVVTHGFVKKTKKTPPAEIDKALRYREDWLKRSKK